MVWHDPEVNRPVQQNATREHWIQHITFAAKTSVADTHTA